jgi:hypothetical protein
MGHITGKLYRAGLGRVSNDTLTVRGTNGIVSYGRGKDVTPGSSAAPFAAKAVVVVASVAIRALIVVLMTSSYRF